MNLQRGYRRVLTVLFVLWSPVAVFWTLQEVPSRLDIEGHGKMLAARYLRSHPFDEGLRVKMYESNLDALRQLPPGPFGHLYDEENAREITENAILYDIVEQDRSMARQAWINAHERMGLTFLYFWILPLAGVLAFYFVSLPVIAWIAEGFKSPS